MEFTESSESGVEINVLDKEITGNFLILLEYSSSKNAIHYLYELKLQRYNLNIVFYFKTEITNSTTVIATAII